MREYGQSEGGEKQQEKQTTAHDVQHTARKSEIQQKQYLKNMIVNHFLQIGKEMN